MIHVGTALLLPRYGRVPVAEDIEATSKESLIVVMRIAIRIEAGFLGRDSSVQLERRPVTVDPDCLVLQVREADVIVGHRGQTRGLE